MVKLPHPLTDQLAELIARRLRLIGDATRIRLLDLLSDGEKSVNALASEMGASQQNVSKHLAALADAGIVTRRRAGNFVYYELPDSHVLDLCEQVCNALLSQAAALTATVSDHGKPSRKPARR